MKRAVKEWQGDYMRV
ncbi:hypothetical protein [Chitinophaga sancti]